ncbi:MAG: hypothetical protein H5U17_00620 [Defluviimonas sp.]|nr:hypothetical protein [Defluviimonas sp.]
MPDLDPVLLAVLVIDMRKVAALSLSCIRNLPRSAGWSPANLSTMGGGSGRMVTDWWEVIGVTAFMTGRPDELSFSCQDKVDPGKSSHRGIGLCAR